MMVKNAKERMLRMGGGGSCHEDEDIYFAAPILL